MHGIEKFAHALTWTLVYVSILATLLFALRPRSGNAGSPERNERRLALALGALALCLPLCFALQWGRPLPCSCDACLVSTPLLALRPGPARLPGALILAACWAACVGLQGLRALAASCRLRHLLSRSELASAALQGDFDALCARFSVRAELRIVSDSISSVPAVFGACRPRVLLPQSCAALPGPELRALLGHELAHQRRGDLRWHLVQRTVTALLFFHPFVHRLSRRLDEQRELACDRLCLSYGTHRTDLARALLRLATRASRLRCPAGTSGDLAQRLRALADPGRPAQPSRGALAIDAFAGSASTICPALIALFCAWSLARSGSGRSDLGISGLVLPFHAFTLHLDGEASGRMLEGADGRRFVSLGDGPFEELLEEAGRLVTRRSDHMRKPISSPFDRLKPAPQGPPTGSRYQIWK